jgi:hypothetical protein
MGHTDMSHGKVRVAADIGGTFTDIALIHADGRVATRKVASTPADYGGGVIEGIRQILAGERLGVEDVGEVLHACTVATNAILEAKGARTGLITTAGFRDVLELRRIRVPRLYEPLYRKPPPLVPRRLRLEVTERLNYQGQILEPLDEASVTTAIDALLAEEVQAVAVCLLHSYANPVHERRIGEMLRARMADAFVSLSVDILPEIREYERTSTTVINSYVGPPVRFYFAHGGAGAAAAALHDALRRRHRGRPHRDAAPGADRRMRAGRGRAERAPCGRVGGISRHHLVRHGGDHRQGVADREWRAAAHGRLRSRRRHLAVQQARQGRGICTEAAGHRYFGSGCRRRQHRLDRPGRCAEGRAA